MKFFKVVDYIPREDRKALGLEDIGQPLPSLGIGARNVHAIATGERRPPKKGEWYLSGAIVEAYRAPNDLSTPFQIARLVKTKTITTTVIVEA